MARDQAREWSNEALRLLASAEAADIDVLNRCVDLLSRAVELTPPHDSSHADYLSNLGIALRARFERTGVLGDLDTAIDTFRRALILTPLGHRDHAMCLHNLGNALLNQFETNGSRRSLDAAVDMLRQALELTAPDHPDYPMYMSNLGNALSERFEETGDLTDLEAAGDTLRQAVDLTPPGHPRQSRRLSHLGNTLLTRFERTGSLTDLDDGIDLLKQAVELTLPSDLDRPMCLSNVGIAVLQRFDRVGEPADLDAAIDTLQQAVELTPVDHPDRTLYLSNYGVALLTRFERSGGLSDLDVAIDTLRQVVDLTRSGHPDLAGYRSNLGIAMLTRFERTGDVTDLNASVDTLHDAVALTPGDHPDRPMYLSNHGSALQTRADRVRDLADLASAIDAHRDAADLTPDDHPHRSRYESNLGLALQTQAEYTDNPDDIGSAIDAHERAVELAPPDHPECAKYQSNLGIALLARSHRADDPADLTAAIDALDRAVELTPSDHPDHARYLSNLGAALQIRHERGAAQSDLDRAIAALRSGADLASAAPSVRVRCGARLARLLAGRDWADADQVWHAVLGLIPQTVDRSLSRGDRQYLLEDFTGVGTAAAAAALANDDADRAWEMLEQGRGVLLGQALETTTDPELRGFPDLAGQLDQVRRDLNLDTSAATNVAAESVVAVRRRAAAQWERLVEAIRSRGFIHFGIPPTVEELRGGLSDEGVVIGVNVTPWRCDALILDKSGTDQLPLPGLDATEAERQADAFLAATRTRGNDRTEGMRQVLIWLWDTVTGPILDHLGHDQPPENDDRWPRVWWMPTGPLTVLPLHAAGYDTADGSGGVAVLDRVVSSYTPTVRALARARRSPAIDTVERRVLAVGLGEAPGHGTLAFAPQEAQAVHTRLRAITPPLVDKSATIGAVRAGLATSRWAHFACHGVPRDDPADSHLAMWDGPLSVREIANLDLPNARLAYLSACTTAFGGTTLPDESIHIASAFQGAGFAHVIATLWAINDQHAPRLAGEFYAHLADGQQPAHATHNAVRALRADFPTHPHLWAPYIHFGP